MKVKTALFSGGKDQLADPKDVQWIRETIKDQTIGDFFFDDFTHYDFIVSMNLPSRVFNLILDLLKEN